MDFKDFDKKLKKAKLLKNKKSNVFTDRYIPPQIYYRDSEINQIRSHIEARDNILIIGDIGTGKTLCVKWIYNIYKANYSHVIPIFHNCRNSTIVDVYYDILTQLGVEFKKNKSINYYITTINKKTSEMNKTITICLDEVNHLFNKYRDSGLLYSLSDPYQIDNVRVILISNSANSYDKTSKKAKNRMQIQIIPFNNYTIDQIKGIIDQRVRIGIEDNFITVDEIWNIANIILNENSNIRDGIKMISRVYDYKKINNIKNSLSMDKLKLFINQIIEQGLLYRYGTLKPNLKITIACISEIIHKNKRDYVTIINVLQYWEKKAERLKYIEKRSHQRIRDYIHELIEYGFLEKRTKSRKERTGYEYIYIPLFNIEEFITYLETEYPT